MRVNSSCSRGITGLVFSISALDLIDLERELIKTNTQSTCEQITTAIILAEMKNRWDTRNRSGNEKYREFFYRYASFLDYCQRAWGYGHTHCNQLVQVGRTIANLTAQCQERCEVFILPASVSEAIDLVNLPENIRLSVWQAYKQDGIPLPLIPRKMIPAEVLSPSLDQRIQTIRKIIVDNLPSEDLPKLMASLFTPSIQEEIQALLSKKPSVDELSRMSEEKSKVDLGGLILPHKPPKNDR